MMQLENLPIIALDQVFEILVLSVGFYEAIRLRITSPLFNTGLTRCLFDTHLVELLAPENRTHLCQLAAPFMARFLLARVRVSSTNASSGLISAIRIAIEAAEAGRPRQPIDQSNPSAVMICKATVWHLGNRQCLLQSDPAEERRYGSPASISGLVDEISHSLSAAIITGNLSQVIGIATTTGINLNASNGYFGSPWELAARFQRVKIVHWLLQHGVDDKMDYVQDLPSIRVLPDWVEYQQLSSLLPRISYGTLELRIACQQGPEECERFLLEHKETSMSEPELQGCLHWAAFKGCCKLVLYLLSKAEQCAHAEKHALPDEVFAIAAGTLNLELLQLMVSKYDADVNDDCCTRALWLVLDPNHDTCDPRRMFSMVRYLLENDADPNPDSCSAPSTPLIHLAIKFGQADIVQLLLSYGADKYVGIRQFEYYGDFMNFFQKAVEAEKIDVARFFRAWYRNHPDLAGPEYRYLRETGWYSQYCALDGLKPVATTGPTELLVFLAEGLSLNDEDRIEEDPVYIAMRAGNDDGVRALLELGAHPVDPLQTKEAQYWRDGSLPLSLPPRICSLFCESHMKGVSCKSPRDLPWDDADVEDLMPWRWCPWVDYSIYRR